MSRHEPNGFQKPVATRRSFLPSAVQWKTLPPSPPPVERRAVGADQLVVGPEVLADAEVEVAA